MYMFVAGAIFVIAYSLIIWDKFDKMVIALCGAALMILTNVLNQQKAFGEIDMNTIFLLISMMIIVITTKKSGVFEYLAIKMVKAAKADPIRILIFLSIITGLLSAFLDNVTTILLVLPVTLNVAKELHFNPVPIIISEVFASNVGGTATLIGDPPNIMIGSSVGLNFIDFLKNDAVIIIPILFITTYVFALVYRKKLVTTEKAKEIIMGVDERSSIRDVKLLKKSLIVLSITMIGFALHGQLHYESATIAISGAAVLMLISGIPPEKILREIEWNTIFFFVGLFIMVGGIKEAGIIKQFAEGIVGITKGNLMLTAMAILWVSAIASAFIDNIPFVATMLPLIKDLGMLTGMKLGPLWWALSLGACLGGNGTVIGASANVIATGMAQEYGHKITFKGYFKIAFPVMIFTIIICTIYLYLRYL